MLSFAKNLFSKKEAMVCGGVTAVVVAAGLATGTAPVGFVHTAVTTLVGAAEVFGVYALGKGMYKAGRHVVEKAKGYSYLIDKGIDMLDNLTDTNYVDTNDQDEEFTYDAQDAITPAEVKGLSSDLKTRNYTSYNTETETVRPEGFKGKLSHVPFVGSYFTTTTSHEVEAKKQAVAMTQREINAIPQRTTRSGKKFGSDF
ncbi:MAG: hypothetical protein BGO43_13270 [Gammaproteobacteria bacterium 39-13]|nr:hypothetical protein [Gammaproteobacteria bacterium]OJV95914.1 MAG: hypothetical protein BGO43_13270 [Gammaproteobacteria bacterium 39-13]